MRGFLTSVLLAVVAGFVLAQECPDGERYSDCGGCEPTCETVGTVVACAAVCRQGCYCPFGMVRDSEGKCIDMSDCPVPGAIGGSGTECDPDDPECETDSDSDCEIDETDRKRIRIFGSKGKPCFTKPPLGRRPDHVHPTGKLRPVDPREQGEGDNKRPHRTRPEGIKHPRTRPEEIKHPRTRPEEIKPPRTKHVEEPTEEPTEEPRRRGGPRTVPVPGDNGGRRRPEEGGTPPPRRRPSESKY